MNSPEPSLDQVSTQLIAYLRAELHDPGLDYDQPPIPIRGGYEAFTYHFKLQSRPRSQSQLRSQSQRPELAKPLVLRLFQRYRNPIQAIRESAVQNALAGQGHPAPAVLFTGTDKAQLGGAFLIMAFLPGQNMLAAAEPADLPTMLGQTHAALHALSAEPLLKNLQAQGFAERQVRLAGRLAWLQEKGEQFPWLRESIDWLLANRPSEPPRLAICHGDFHPLNILVAEGQVSAVLDWPGFMIGDPVMDVAFTMVLCTIAAKQLLPGQNWDEILAQYLAAYREERPLDMTHLNYYRLLRCVVAFIDGAEGQAVWRSPAAVNYLRQHVDDIANIDVVDYTVDRET